MEVLILPSEVTEWTARFQCSNGLQAMWRLLEELMDATQGRKHWVDPVGNAIALTWEVKRAIAPEECLHVPTPSGTVMARLMVEVPNRLERSGVGG